MNGDQINSKLERGFFGKSEIKKLVASGGWSQFSVPSDSSYSKGVNDSVTEQFHRASAKWDDSTKTLTISMNSSGKGGFIPWRGEGSGMDRQSVGVAITSTQGLGTYTPVIPLGSPISWVLTGPFSGCHCGSMPAAGGGMVFVHATTPDAGYTADPIESQLFNVGAQTGASAVAAKSTRVLSGKGNGYVFWTLIGRQWYQRIVWEFAGTINGVERKTRV